MTAPLRRAASHRLRGLADTTRELLRAGRDELTDRQERAAETADLASAVAAAGGALRRHLLDRMAVLLQALDAPVPDGEAERARAVEDALAGADGSRVWLALAVLTGHLPLDADVVAAQRRLRLDGPGRALGPPVAALTSWLSGDRWHPARVEVVTGQVVADLHHTSRTDLATGIQRVAREAARRWNRDHDVVLVGWTEDYTALRRLDPRSARRAVGEQLPSDLGAPPATDEDETTVVVPWQGTWTLLELATEEPRTRRIQALARWSGNRTGVIGFDTVPLTMAETTAEAMGGAFAGLLAGVRHVDRVATISRAAGVEYEGWRSMLAGSGWPGPDVRVVSLAVTAVEPSPEALEETRSRFCVGHLPMVLCIGSHEPRKNHLAVLHAAELLWRRGVEFSLLFVGGNAWNSDRFRQTLDGLRGAGRPVESISGLDDEALWSAYRLARVSLFPSLGEGFGLPVGESLASGTPVVTTRYGSTAEIAEHGGALLVDPRDDADIADALGRLLTDPALHAQLVEQARSRPERTWDAYAAELWDVLVASPARDEPRP